MRNQFDRQLNTLNGELIQMGHMVEQAIEHAIEAMVHQDAEKAKKKGMTFLEVEKNRMLLTCAGVSAEKYEDAMKLLRECTEKGMN